MERRPATSFNNMILPEGIAVEPPAIGQVLDLAGLFDRQGPVEMEIGCGKGGFLLRQAQAHPERYRYPAGVDPLDRPLCALGMG